MRMTPTRRDAADRGAVAVLVAIMSVLLVICIAFAVDLGYAWQVKRSMVKATDAAALAAARQARDESVAGQTLGSGSCAPAAVAASATSALGANRSDATMDFCAIANSSARKRGVVTVRATTEAQMSFSRIIGFDEVTVRSSTSALWEQARLLPFAACAVKGNSSAADWAEDPSSPVSTVLQASSSDTSTMCSGGKSGAFGVIDLDSRPNSATNFTACRTDDVAIGEDVEEWFDEGYDGNIPIDAYRCATVGQYYGSSSVNVDRAICLIPQGSLVALPVVTATPRKQSSASSKQWIVRISGYALTRFDDYTGNNGTDLCSEYRNAASAARRDRTPDRPLRARPIVMRPRAAIGDVSIAQTGTWPASVTLNTSTTLTVTVTNGTDSESQGPQGPRDHLHERHPADGADPDRMHHRPLRRFERHLRVHPQEHEEERHADAEFRVHTGPDESGHGDRTRLERDHERLEPLEQHHHEDHQRHRTADQQHLVHDDDLDEHDHDDPAADHDDHRTHRVVPGAPHQPAEPADRLRTHERRPHRVPDLRGERGDRHGGDHADL